MEKKNDVQADESLKTKEQHPQIKDSQFYYWAMDFIWNKAQEIMDKEFKDDNSGSDIINDLYYKQHYEAKIAQAEYNEKVKQKDHFVEIKIQIEKGEDTDTIINYLTDVINDIRLPVLINEIENIRQLKKIIWMARKRIWTLRWNK